MPPIGVIHHGFTAYGGSRAHPEPRRFVFLWVTGRPRALVPCPTESMADATAAARITVKSTHAQMGNVCMASA